MRILTSLIVAACSASAFAWDASGHELVVEIALKNCKPATAAKVRQLLASAKWTEKGKTHDYTNPGVAGRFADDILNSQFAHDPYEKTNYKKWHYLDLEIADNVANLANWPPSETKGTVIEGINDAIARIKGAPGVTAYPQGKTEALLFLLHFVGDIHQPLHCADNHDAGGHFDLDLETPEGKTIVPHAWWDGAATVHFKLKAANGGQTPTLRATALKKIDSAADQLVHDYAGGFTTLQLESKNPLDWAKESYKYAYGSIYNAARPVTPITLDAWQTAALKRVTLAGLRLGKLLDRLAPSL